MEKMKLNIQLFANTLEVTQILHSNPNPNYQLTINEDMFLRMVRKSGTYYFRATCDNRNGELAITYYQYRNDPSEDPIFICPLINGFDHPCVPVIGGYGLNLYFNNDWPILNPQDMPYEDLIVITVEGYDTDLKNEITNFNNQEVEHLYFNNKNIDYGYYNNDIVFRKKIMDAVIYNKNGGDQDLDPPTQNVNYEEIFCLKDNIIQNSSLPTSQVKTFTFNPNGGTTSISTTSATANWINLPCGWTIDIKGVEASFYIPGGIYIGDPSQINFPLICKAQWVKWDPVHSTPITFPDGTQCTRRHATLLGWALTQDATIPLIQPGQSIYYWQAKDDYPTTWYAVWERFGVYYTVEHKATSSSTWIVEEYDTLGEVEDAITRIRSSYSQSNTNYDIKIDKIDLTQGGGS